RDPQSMLPVFRAELNGLFGLKGDVAPKAWGAYCPAANSVTHENLDEVANVHEFYLLVFGFPQAFCSVSFYLYSPRRIATVNTARGKKSCRAKNNCIRGPYSSTPAHSS